MLGCLLQIPGIGRIDANDLDPAVVQAMKRNVEHNGEAVSSKVHPTCNDVRLLMMQNPLVSCLQDEMISARRAGLWHT